MNRNFVILLILLTLVICSPFYLHVCLAHANGDANTPTFELDLEPVRPQAWLEWRPSYETNVSFRATLKGTTSQNQAIEFDQVTMTFDLGTPSNWKGVCMNYDGEPDTEASPDLFFRNKDNKGGSGQTFTVSNLKNVPGETGKQENAEEDPIVTGLVLTVSGKGVTTVTVSVRVNDYAAVGILSVNASFNYKDPTSGSTSPTGKADDEISIPLDNNGNDIADGWNPDPNKLDKFFDKNANYDPWADKENGPGINKYTGDGFTVFEEYRGFYVKGSHTSIHPSRKDVFIYSELAEGIGYASGLPSPIITHEIDWDEANYLPNPNPREGNTYPETTVPLGDECWVNFNSCGSALQVVEQRAIWVQKKFPTASPGVFGATFNGGPPHELECIEIYVSSIGAAETETNTRRVELDEDSFPQGVPAGGAAARLPEYKRRVIGHEIGHGVGLYHPFDPIPSSERLSGARPRYHDRLRYNINYCQYEAGIHVLPTTKPHGPISRCKPGFSVWDSGSTIMDYGSETEKIRFIGNSRYSRISAHYLAAFLKSTEYLARIHDVEYMFVNPSVAAAHTAKTLPDPLRKSKPQWSPPVDDSTNSNTNTKTNSDTSTTAPPPPDAPTGLSMTAGDGQIRLSWSPVSGTVTEYKYRYRKNGGSWSSWISAGLATAVDVMNLVNGSTYQFEVIAMNGQVVGVVASTSLGVTPATVPGAPTSLSAYRYNGWVSLSWTAPSDDGGADISDYEYQYSRASQSFGSSWTSWGRTNTLNSVFGLTNGTRYKFRIRAVNRAGESLASNTAYATPATTPSAPRNLKATAGDGEVSLYWDAPSSNGGSTIRDYKYSYREGSSGSWSSWTSAGTDQWERVTDLTNNTLYQFRVHAINYVGTSAWAGPCEATPQALITVPGAPTGLSANLFNGRIRLTWTAPSNNGGSSITDYEYRYRENNTGSWGSWISARDTSSSEKIYGLTSGTLYGFQVRAVNNNGESEPSNTATGTTPSASTAPSAPTGLSANLFNGRIRLTWTAPSNNGGSSITDYEYRYRENNTGSWGSWISARDTSSSEKIYGLTSGTLYGFQVRAVNNNGKSLPSNTATGTAR